MTEQTSVLYTNSALNVCPDYKEEARTLRKRNKLKEVGCIFRSIIVKGAEYNRMLLRIDL